MSPSSHLTRAALAVYSVMATVSLVICWWLEINPWRTQWQTSPWSTHVWATAYGLLAAIPLAILLLVWDYWPPRFLSRLKESIEDQVVPLLMGLSLTQCALLAICAGIGEELLFRGLLQTWLEGWLPDSLPGGKIATSIFIAGVAFGACHWLNDQYALMAALVGMYLGLLYVVCDHLFAPMVAHAAYDFFALWYLARTRPQATDVPSPTLQSPPSDGT